MCDPLSSILLIMKSNELYLYHKFSHFITIYFIFKKGVVSLPRLSSLVNLEFNVESEAYMRIQLLDIDKLPLLDPLLPSPDTMLYRINSIYIPTSTTWRLAKSIVDLTRNQVSCLINGHTGSGKDAFLRFICRILEESSPTDKGKYQVS